MAGLGLLVVLGGVGLLLYRYYSPPREGKTSPSANAAGVRDFIQSRGEETMKKRTALTLAVVYERMLAQFPENLELKKKLADAYTEAGQPEKASPLLDEIAKSEQK